MPQRQKLLDKVARNPRNVAFTDFVRLVEGVGFIKTRQTGSHALYQHRDNPALKLNIQPIGNRAKPYQVRDLLEKIQGYNLHDD